MTLTSRGKAVAIASLLASSALIGVATAGYSYSDDGMNRHGIPRCLEDEVVSARATCVHPDTADFRQGRWYADKGGK
jgi:hypothetical protein